MDFGARLRFLWRIRSAVAICAAFAFVTAVASVTKIYGSPPRLEPRALKIATASTQVLVDSPRSALTDIRQDTYGIDSLTNRAVLLGNVMAGRGVRDSIERRAGLSAGTLEIVPPLTPKHPRVLAEAGNERRTGDILKLNDQYRVSIQSNPTVPILHIYAQTPDKRSAIRLANAAVDALRAHLSGVASSRSTPAGDQIRLMQLGRARGAVINGGVDLQVAFLAFILTFALSLATVILIYRVYLGWSRAALAEQPATG
jgi:hypothetical protein